MSNSFYIRVREKIQGPYDVERLRHLASRGRFGRQHKVSVDGVTWEPAGNYAELFPVRVERKVRKQPVVEEPVEQPSPEPEQQPETNLTDDVTGEQEWYYIHGDQQFGPVPFDELQVAIATGQLTANGMIWRAGMPEWAPAESVLPSLFTTDATTLDGEISTQQADQVKKQAIRAAPMAVASLVLGLLGMTFLFCFGSVLAVVFGHVAWSQIKDSEGQLGGRGMALSGLIMGYAIIGIVLILVVVRLSMMFFDFVFPG